MTRQERLAGELVNVAAELVGTVRDYGPELVAEVLAKVPDGRHDALAVVLAAMVDPDRSTADLLAWTEEPVQSRTFEPASLRTDRTQRQCPDCKRWYRASHLSRHRRTHVSAVA